MRKLLQSWLFFTALLIFLLVCAAAVTPISDRLFGSTEAELSDAFARAEANAQQVWGSILP